MTDAEDAHLAEIIAGLRRATGIAEQAFNDLHCQFEQIGSLVVAGATQDAATPALDAVHRICQAITVDMQFIDRFAQYQHAAIAALEAMQAGEPVCPAPCGALLAFDKTGLGVELF